MNADRIGAGLSAASAWLDTIVISVVTAVAVGLGVGPPVQSWIVFVFMLLYPGMPYVRMLRVGSLLIEWTLAVALSIALDVIVAEVMVYTRLWSPQGGTAALIAIALIGVAIQAATWVRGGRRRGTST